MLQGRDDWISSFPTIGPLSLAVFKWIFLKMTDLFICILAEIIEATIFFAIQFYGDSDIHNPESIKADMDLLLFSDFV